MQRKIKILVVEPNELPKVAIILNTLKAKQEVVKGDIEYAYRDNYSDIVFICNEEGKVNNLPFNRDIGGAIIAGTFIIAGDDLKFGEDRSLTEKQINKYSTIFGQKSIDETKEKLEEIISSFEI